MLCGSFICSARDFRTAAKRIPFIIVLLRRSESHVALSDWWSVHMRPWKGSKRRRRKFGCWLLQSLSRIYYTSLYKRISITDFFWTCLWTIIKFIARYLSLACFGLIGARIVIVYMCLSARLRGVFLQHLSLLQNTHIWRCWIDSVFPDNFNRRLHRTTAQSDTRLYHIYVSALNWTNPNRRIFVSHIFGIDTKVCRGISVLVKIGQE